MALTPLLFGREIARRSNTFAEASAAMVSLLPRLRLFDAGASKVFHAMTATCEVGELKVMASARQACSMEIDEGPGWHLALPTAGSVSVTCDGRRHALLASRSALILPNLERLVQQEASASVVLAAINPATLRKTMTAMTGMEQDHMIDLRPHTLRLDSGGNMYEVFRGLCRLIEATIGKPGLGGKLGLDDMIYRWMVTNLLAPGEDGEPISSDATARIDLVCDMVRHAIDRPMTLTEMELASGLSARTLQYAFKARFNCSPMAWQRRERMLEARKRLMQLDDGETITQLAHAMGYSSSAAFATGYRHQFGETPSQTLARGHCTL